MKFVIVKHDDQHEISAETFMAPNAEFNVLVTNYENSICLYFFMYA